MVGPMGFQVRIYPPKYSFHRHLFNELYRFLFFRFFFRFTTTQGDVEGTATNGWNERNWGIVMVMVVSTPPAVC
jgi:hypothetical protein